MKLYLTFMILLLVAYSKSETNCEDITPTKLSDCVLSEEDKKTNKYKYCCLDEFLGKLRCEAYTKESYEFLKELSKELNKELGKDSKTESEPECNNSSYLKFGIIFFIILLF